MTDRSTQKGVRPKRILVVDDEKQICNIITTMLVAAGYGCREAASGLEALAMLESGDQFDLMLSNLLMPDLDGFALLERTQRQYPDMFVVIVTGEHDVSVALSAIRNGAFDCLMKPFEHEQLLDTVSRALEKQSLELEQRAYISNLESQVATLTEKLRGRKS